MKVNWRRLIWVIFICLYSVLFFYNFFSRYPDWLVPYLYTMGLVVWLSLEYYEKRLFFQTGFVPLELYSWPLRVLFALFFYSSFIIGVSTQVWWFANKINLYPFVHVVGIVLLAVSIGIRRSSLQGTLGPEKAISHFYFSLMFLVSSLALGYGSLFLVWYVIVIGFPLIYLQRRFELGVLKDFGQFLHSKKGTEAVDAQEYNELLQAYYEKQLKRKGKR